MQLIVNEGEILDAVKDWLYRKGFYVEDLNFRYAAQPEIEEIEDVEILVDLKEAETDGTTTEGKEAG